MIPDRDAGARPPLTLEFAFVLALLAPLVHVVCVMVLSLIGFQGFFPVVGMGAVLAYAGLFTLCALRFREPPLQQLALVRAPASAWIAVVFLAASVVLASEMSTKTESSRTFPTVTSIPLMAVLPNSPPIWR